MSYEGTGSEKTPIRFDIWRTSSTTEHIGGIFAAQRLLDLCHITPGQRVLDIGCRTGFTACYLTKKHPARVVAIDISPTSSQQVYRRASREQVRDRIAVLNADAHRLACISESFDVVILESVLIFCRADVVVSEAYRVLKSGGIFGDNELALVGTPPGELNTLLLETLGIHAFSD